MDRMVIVKYMLWIILLDAFLHGLCYFGKVCDGQLFFLTLLASSFTLAPINCNILHIMISAGRDARGVAICHSCTGKQYRSCQLGNETSIWWSYVCNTVFFLFCGYVSGCVFLPVLKDHPTSASGWLLCGPRDMRFCFCSHRSSARFNRKKKSFAIPHVSVWIITKYKFVMHMSVILNHESYPALSNIFTLIFQLPVCTTGSEQKGKGGQEHSETPGRFCFRLRVLNFNLYSFYTYTLL